MLWPRSRQWVVPVDAPDSLRLPRLRGGFRWGGYHWNRTEGRQFTEWLNQHGANAEAFATKHPELAATFGPNWPDTSVKRIAARIDKVLARYDSPLVGEGMAFAKAGADWDVNPFIVATIAGAESTFGRQPCVKDVHNVFGWASCRGPEDFVSYKHAIFVVTRALRRTYMDKHGDSTFYELTNRYCACGPQYPERAAKILKLFESGEGITFQAGREAVL